MAVTEKVGREGQIAVGERVRLLRTMEQVEAERSRWEALPWGRVDADLDYFLEVVVGRGSAPYVALVERGGEIVGALAARLERRPLEVSVGYRVLYRPVVRSVTLVHGGVVCEDAATARALAAELDATLSRGDADVVILPSIPTGGSLFSAVDERSSALRRGRFAETRPHHRLVLPESFDSWLASWTKKSRYNIKRQSSLFEGAYPDQLSVRLLREPGDFDRIFRDVERVASKTYQRGLGVGFADSEEYRRLVALSLDRNWFRAYVLYLGAEPIAFWQGYAYRETFFSSTMGYDASYADYSPGAYLQMKVFENLFEDPGVAVVDFGLGDADYKRRFGNETWEERDVAFFAPTVRALRINLTRSAVLGGAQLAKASLARLGLTSRVKRLWRGRLRAQDRGSRTVRAGDPPGGLGRRVRRPGA